MGPEAESLTMYGHPSELPPLAWSWVEAELAGAGSYWVTARGTGHPHPRPVWGVWSDGQLHLSIGSPVVGRLLEDDSAVTVHLSSDIDVVIVEGDVSGFAGASALYQAYNEKYDWDYSIEEYGPLTTVTPSKILAWRSAGWAGRDGFQNTGRWRLEDQQRGAAEAR